MMSVIPFFVSCVCVLLELVGGASLLCSILSLSILVIVPDRAFLLSVSFSAYSLTFCKSSLSIHIVTCSFILMQYECDVFNIFLLCYFVVSNNNNNNNNNNKIKIGLTEPLFFGFSKEC